MDGIYLDPEELNSLLSAFSSKVGEAADKRFDPDPAGLELNSVDKLMLCMEAMNDTLKKIGALAELDTESIVKLKADWMGTDAELANTKFETIVKKAAEDLTDKVYGRAGKTEN